MTASRERAESILTLAEGALGLLNSPERQDAETLLALCREYWDFVTRPQSPLPISSGPGTKNYDTKVTRPEQIRKQAAGLVELLARRSAPAMPYAALGRALVADTYGASSDRDRLFIEFEAKMSMLGL